MEPADRNRSTADEIVWWVFAAVQAVIGLLLLSLDASAWAYSWSVGVVVTVIVAALLWFVWRVMLETRREL